MNRHLIAVAALVTLLPACGSDPPVVEAPAPVSEAPALPPTAEAPTVSLTTTGVFIDPTIASACGVEQPKAFFKYDSADLKVGDMDALDGVVTCLMTGALKGKSIEVVGRADPRGEDDYNKQLGRSRADSVAEYMAGKGMEKAKLTARSTGEEKATGTDEHGWALDRRVDVRLAK